MALSTRIASHFLSPKPIQTKFYALNKNSIKTYLATPTNPFGLRDEFVEKLHANHHLNPIHPIGILKKKIDLYFQKLSPDSTLGIPFDKFEDFSIKLSTKQNFDELLIDKRHPSRLPSESFYLDANTVIRTQATAHQPELLRKGIKSAIWSAVVARKDEIDKFHYPIFYQYDAFKIFPENSLTMKEIQKIVKPSWNLNSGNPHKENPIILHLQCLLEGLIDFLFGENIPRRWDYSETFPFTIPSLELEIFYNEIWIELLGCGQIHKKIMENCQLEDSKGWAFGMGLDRLTMVLFNIPDIRLLWTKDPRFHEQFQDGEIKNFKPFSKHPGVYKDVAFWINTPFEENQLFQTFRESAGDLLESVKLIDEYTNPHDGRKSRCYRLLYRALERNLTNDEINILHRTVVEKVVDTYDLIER